jgi:glycosyltransferase involved in cell wall biosynthesis
MQKISIVTIAKNEGNYIEDFLQTVKWANEIIIVDNGSSDKTIEIAHQFSKNIYINTESNLGLLRKFALSKATNDWILLLDVDELITESLRKEIQKLLIDNTELDAFFIPYINFFYGRELTARIFKYSKIRLFRKHFGTTTSVPIHEEVVIKGKIGYLKAKLVHYSFRNVIQTVRKFTYYALLEARLLYSKNERVSLRKLTLYPLHMFWAIFIKDQGYRDGIWGFGIALCFAYYEFAKYFFVLVKQFK